MAQYPSIDHLFNAPQTIRLDWLIRVAGVSGKTLHIGLALIGLAAISESPRVQLKRSVMARFNLSREAVYDGLKRLESEKLIQVWRLPGRLPVIILLEADGRPLQVKVG